MATVHRRSTADDSGSSTTNKRQKTPSNQSAAGISSPLKACTGSIAPADISSALVVDGSGRRLQSQSENHTFDGVDELWSRFLGVPGPGNGEDLLPVEGESWTRETIREHDWSTEAGFVQGANHVCNSCGLDSLFRNADHASLLSSGTRVVRRPDVVLLHPEVRTDPQLLAGGAQKYHWSDVAMTIQVKNSEQHKDAWEQLLRDWEHIFASQPGRWFALGLTVWKDELKFHVGGSSGCISTSAVKYNEQPSFLAAVIKQLTQLKGNDYGLWVDFCSPEQMSKPNFQFGLPLTGGGKLQGRVLGSICHRQEVVGRSTRVYSAILPGDKSVACKLLCRDVERIPEMEVLKAIAASRDATAEGFAGLPRLADSGADVVLLPTWRAMLGDVVWLRMKQENPKKLLIDRVLEITLTEPATADLRYARSSKQLVGAVIDAIKGHQRLSAVGYLHRDISFGNILLGPNWQSTEWDIEGERGVLHDFDMAKKVDDSAHGERTGTYPFIALDLLVNPTAPHTVSHDLESFIYVIIWIATMYDCSSKLARRSQGENPSAEYQSPPVSIVQARNAANSKRESKQDGIGVRVFGWVNDPNGDKKRSCFMEVVTLKLMLDQIQPCWATLRDSQLLDKLALMVQRRHVPPLYRPADAAITYASVLEALEEAYPKL